MSARYGLLGEKLGHSLLPQIHRELGGYEYALMEVGREDLPAFFATRDFQAVNVAMPYMEAVLPWMDSLSETAAKTGCVNTVVKDSEGALHGYNTEYYGFTRMVRRSRVGVSGRKCLVLGRSGMSDTVRTVLEDLGASEIVMISQSGSDYEENIARHTDAQVIVNTTSAGMYPENGVSLIELSRFPAIEGVLDLIYHPAKTTLLLEADALGIPNLNGLYMQVAQAKQASELFQGLRIDDSEISRIHALIAAQTANIVLIGMPGSGKTTVGRRLSENGGRPFVDTDSMIEEQAGCTCGDFLRTYGEAAFRKLETEVLQKACMRTGCVIATGGGVVTRPENRDILRRNGVVFYLKRPVERLVQYGDRPLSSTPEKLQTLWKVRAPLYESMRDYEVPYIDEEKAAGEIERLMKTIWTERL